MPNTLLRASLLIALTSSAQGLSSQTIDYEDLMHRGEIGYHQDFAPESLASLVGSSAVIVKGRFGDFLDNVFFFGYDENGRVITRRESEFGDSGYFGAERLSFYEIIIDKVFLGENLGEKIILSRDENPPSNRKYTDPDIERLFFLLPAPDGTYGTLGVVAIQSLRAGEYTYDTNFIDPDSDVITSLPFLKGLSAEVVEEKVREEVRRLGEC